MIRPATPDDIESIVALGANLVRRGAYAHTTISFKACINRLTRALRSQDEWLGVAEHNGKVVGFLIVVIVPYWWSSTEKYALDDGIYCTRAGLGRKLVEAGTRWAFRRGALEVLIALTSSTGAEDSAMRAARSAAALVAGAGYRERGVVVSQSIDSLAAGRKKWAA